MYVLDVSGHGVGPALMGVSAMNLIRSGSLEKEQVLDPTRVLQALNNAFQMSRHDGMYFTVWYGIYHRGTRELRWSGGGHPPSFLMRGGKLTRLASTTFMACIVDQYDAPTESIVIEPGDRLYLFSDGVYELQTKDDGIWGLDKFDALLAGLPADQVLDGVVAGTRNVVLEGRGIAPDSAQAQTGAVAWDDDFSLIEFRFN
jgi:sigma-B regulation protein RsbU (phosphoserine phosphatase)